MLEQSSIDININNMMQCLLLATQGQGYVSPNPLVGAMLVHNGEMIGAGYHQQYGTEHAEVHCINSVQANHKDKIKDSVLYVNLEPCNHTGKTPPCTELIIASGIRKVVIGSRDPNSLVNGTGVKALQDAGIEVIENMLHAQCLAVNRRFFTYQQLQRPYIILKWAETADGFVANEDKTTLQISGEQANKMNHTWRSQEDAIMVGYNTVLLDDPQLNVRLVDGRNPVRIVWDPHNELPMTKRVFNKGQPTLIINNHIEKIEKNIVWKKLVFLQEIITYLHQCKTLSIIIEGGPKTIQQLIDADMWDEARIIKSTVTVGKGYKANALRNQVFLYDDPKGSDTIQYYKHKQNIYL
jgi:diaminohydroxyphosphoribosylaminopyrimidine deaminase / 5-amino-6-(5-phosphoribosylamino)uracil reductase